MAETTSNLPVKSEQSPAPPQVWGPFESLRQEIDRVFDQFGGGLWRPFHSSLFDAAPFRRAEAALGTMPAVDVSQTDKAYEITAELPSMDEKNVEVKVANGVLCIKGEKQEEKERRKEEGLLQARAQLRLVRALVPGARWRRYRQD